MRAGAGAGAPLHLWPEHVPTSVVVFLDFWVFKKEPSVTHPYGYERAEDIAGVGVAAVIFASAIFAGLLTRS